jgi:hypothetical protein
MKERHESYATINRNLNIKTCPIYLFETCGLYYKYVTIVNDDSRVINKQSFKLIDDSGVIIYDCHRFIIQATVLIFEILMEQLFFTISVVIEGTTEKALQF